MAAFQLCQALGVQHPDKLDLTAKQFGDWLDFWEALHGDPTPNELQAKIKAAFGGQKRNSPT